MSRILAIDYGVKKTGVAVTDPNQWIATPLITLKTKKCISFLRKYFDIYDIKTIVIGLPRYLNNTYSDFTYEVEKFVHLIKEKFPEKKIVTFDEKYTSQMAKQSIAMMGIKKKDKKKLLIDKISATLILQSFLEQREKRCNEFKNRGYY